MPTWVVVAECVALVLLVGLLLYSFMRRRQARPLERSAAEHTAQREKQGVPRRLSDAEVRERLTPPPQEERAVVAKENGGPK